jgi:ABC-type glycerol-3-phosphate transport system substrate-binding protein
MKARKILWIGVALMLGVSMMAMAVGASQAGAAGSGGGVTNITYWSNDAGQDAFVSPWIQRWNQTTGAARGIFLDYTVYGADWQTAMNLAMESNREPDIMKGFTNYEQYVTAGRLLPWTEIPGIEDILAAHAPLHRNQTSLFNGVPYSIIWSGWYSGFHYNKALVQRAGFAAPPRTWAEFEQQAIAISRLEPGRIYGYAMPLVWTPDFTTWMTEYFAASSIGHMYWNFTEGKFMFADFTPYFEMLGRIRDAGAMFPGMESLSDDQQRAYFADGRIGFIGGAGWNVGVLYDQFPFGGGASGSPANPTGWDYAPMPVQNLNQTYAVPVSAGAYVFVSAKVRNDRDKLSKIGEAIRCIAGDDFQIAAFEYGAWIPLRSDITSRARPGARPQTTTYGQSVTRTVTMPAGPTTRITPEGADRVAVIGQILTGQIPVAGIRAALEDLDRRYNAAFDQAIARNQLNRADFIDPTFEQRLAAR